MFFLFLLEGWNVLFIVIQCFICLFSRFADYARIVQTSCCFEDAKVRVFFQTAKLSETFFVHMDDAGVEMANGGCVGIILGAWLLESGLIALYG